MSAQPEKGEAANVSGNPISKDQAQQSASRADKGLDGGSIERREPQNQMSSDYAQPTSKGQGISGGGPGEKAGDVRGPDKGTSELEEKDMQGAAGEGRTADAVKGKSGASSIGGNKHSAGA